jgi:hypothetical protein
MRLSIISTGDARRTVADSVFDGTFSELAENFSTYRPNKSKHDGYIVRGELHGKRSNINLPRAEILVLDGDQTGWDSKNIENPNSAPNPKILHDFLVEENINHFIYTTHSYAPPEKIKWRCVIECPMEDKGQLKPTLQTLFEFLHKNEYPLLNVKENWTWSQPWFFPNRDEDDGKFIFLKYLKGVPFLAQEADVVSTSSLLIKNAPIKYDSETSYRDNVSAIREGISYYKELQNILYGMAKDGRAKDVIEADAEMIMLASKAANPNHPEHEKWQQRYDQIPTYVQQAVDCEKEDDDYVDLTDIEVKDSQVQHHNLDFPPALAGELCKNFYEMSPHPNEEIALVGAIGLIAGIVGRKYNVLGTGLNIYATLLADSGVGKSVIKNGVNKALRASGIMQAGTYSGASRFTGPKAIFEMLSLGMSRVCVIEEAGLVNESQAGDTSGINRAMLDLYTSSGAGEYAGGENYSDSKQNIPVLASPALTIVNISTPKSYLQAMKNKGSELSGEIARMWLTRTLREKSYLNVSRRKDFDKDVRNRINELIQFCMDKQDPNKPDKVIDIEIDGVDLQKESNYWVDKENEFKSQGDTLRRTIASRAFIKTVKLAAIVSVFNGYSSIDKDSFNWAKKAVETEMMLIQQTFMFEATDDLSELVLNTICPVILKMVKGGYQTVKISPNAELRKRGMFTLQNISQAMKQNKLLKELDDDTSRANPKTGIEKAIEYMIRNDLLFELKGEVLVNTRRKTRTKSRRLYQITDSFKLAMEDNV